MFSEPWEGQPYSMNIGVILGVRHNFLIDTGRGSGDVAPVLELLKDSDLPLVVINTHMDYDHVWGNHCFENCMIIAHESCRELLDKTWDEEFEQNKHHARGEVKKCLPNVTFTDKMDFWKDGVHLLYTPGHTSTCISVYDSVDKVLYAGDNIGDTNEEILPEIHTDRATFKKLINTYESIEFDICVSGHNVPQGKDVLARLRHRF